jgi:hypothetical protein
MGIAALKPTRPATSYKAPIALLRANTSSGTLYCTMLRLEAAAVGPQASSATIAARACAGSLAWLIGRPMTR